MSGHLEPIPPGEILLCEFMEPLGISQNRLARDIEVPVSRVAGIVKGARAITADTALRLGAYFGVSAEMWRTFRRGTISGGRGKLPGRKLGTASTGLKLRTRRPGDAEPEHVRRHADGGRGLFPGRTSCRMMHKTSRRARLREAPILREPNWLRSPKGTAPAAETWSAFHPPDGGQVFPPGDEGADERQKECLAEPSERGIWFQVKGLPNDIGVIFLEDNPQTKVLVQSGAPFLNQGNLDRRNGPVRVPWW